ncbi:MAG: DNRLRE domain-containing protein [Candidatus Eiseniibacteriota bacterium]
MLASLLPSLIIVLGLTGTASPLAAQVCETQVIETGTAFHVVIDGATQLGAPLEAGEHVRLYDTYEDAKIVVGYAAVTGTWPLHIVAWQRDDALDLPGFTPGHALEIRLCDPTQPIELEGHPEPLDDAVYGTGEVLHLSSVGFLPHEPPPAPVLSEPPDDTRCVPLNPVLRWLPVPDTIVYTIQLGSECGLGEVLQAAFPEITWQPLQPAGHYFWRVRATDSFGAEGPYSECFGFGTLPLTPGLAVLEWPPDGATGQSLDGVLEWSAVPGVSGYEVQIDSDGCGNGPIVQVTTPSLEYSGLEPFTTYDWRVRATNSCEGIGDWTSCFQFTTAPVAVPSPVPLEPVDGATCQPDSVELVWSEVPDAVLYTVRFSTSSGTIEEREVSGTSTVWGDLEPSATYFWRVRVTVDEGWQSPFSPRSRFSTAPPVPGTATLVAPPPGADDQPRAGTLDWEDVPGAVGYRVQLGTDCGAGPMAEVSASEFPYSGLLFDTTYFWRVEARNVCGEYGDPSDCFSFTTEPVPANPAELVLRDGLNGYDGTDDNAMIDTRPDDNWGTSQELSVAALNIPLDVSDVQRSLIRFDLSGLSPSATILSATLRLFNHHSESPAPLEVSAYRLVKSWVEGTRGPTPQPEQGASCWNAARLGLLPWSEPGASAASDLAVNNDPDLDRFATPEDTTTLTESGVWYAWDLTEATRRWVAGDWQNDGVLLQAALETGSNRRLFHASEFDADPELRPYLVVSYVPGPGLPPVADAGGPYTGNSNQPIQLDGTGSHDPDGTVVTYAWDFGDGATGSGPQPTHAFPAGGDYLVSLVVVDDQGMTSEAASTIAHIQQAETVVLRNGEGGYAGADDNTLIDSRPDDNFGGADHIGIGTHNGPPDIVFTHRLLIRFDVSSIAGGMPILDARLRLYNHVAENTDPIEVAAYRVVKTWAEGSRSGPPEPQEGSSCWNAARLGELDWSLPGASAASDQAVNQDPDFDRYATPEDVVELGPEATWYEWDVTDAVQQWANGVWDNEGLLLAATVEAGTNDRLFRSCEYAADPGLRPCLVVTYETGAAGQGADPPAEEAGGPAAGVPTVTRLLGAFPNPFHRATAVRYELATPADVTLRIYDAGGHLLRVLGEERQPAGRHELAWDGRLGSGAAVPRGVYFYRIESGQAEALRATGKLLYLR